jgi:hypothetical protein
MLGFAKSSLSTKETPMNKLEFWNACASFDWFFECSDDFRVWSQASALQDRLLDQTRDKPECLAIWNAWQSWAFSDKKSPAPLKADFGVE